MESDGTHHDGTGDGFVHLKAVLGSPWEPTIVQIPIKYSSPSVIASPVFERVVGEVVDDGRCDDARSEGDGF